MNDEILQVFVEEAEDLLGIAEQALLNLNNLDDQTETSEGVNDLFRTFHTIKGAAGLFGLDAIVDFTHIVESVLGRIREGALTIDEDMVSLFLLSNDHLERLVSNALGGADEINGELRKTDGELVTRLNKYLGNLAVNNQPSIPVEVMVTSEENAGGVVNENWHISLRFGPNALRHGMDPASFIDYLNNIGELKSVNLIEDAIPHWSEFDPESCYLGFEIELYAPSTDKGALEEVFDFVQEDCKISILAPHSHIDAYIKLIEDLPEEDMRIGEILVACGAVTALEKDNILNTQNHIKDELTAGSQIEKAPQLGEVAVAEQVVQKAVVDAAVKKQKDLKNQRFDAQKTVRVNALKLESLVNLVGELVIGSANADLQARRSVDASLSEAMENLLRLVEEVRDTALGLRMVQIGETFNRFKRVVREVSRDLRKEINLRISGSDTELDKTLIEKISDPLMHLMRNAIDHGIESPEVRVDAGKPAMGTIDLEAFHDSGSIVIKIKDDGGGLNKERIFDKALAKGLVQESQQLTDQEIYGLIFEAGFSTAERVNNLSGRGVGMDVVRKNIESLRGQVEVESETGKGTAISIRLPLTLAIIDGFQVRVGNDNYILPLDMVEECIELNDSLRGKDENVNYVNLRGEILPFMHLCDLFGATTDRYEKHRDNIVVVSFAGKKAGFLVDELLGELQTVIKPIGKVFQNLKGISGATILGSGEVAMIIDIPEIVGKVINFGQKNFIASKAIH